jgi:hypothetical protein
MLPRRVAGVPSSCREGLHGQISDAIFKVLSAIGDGNPRRAANIAA